MRKLGASSVVEIVPIGSVCDVFTKRNQLSPQMQVEDLATVFLGIEDRDRGLGELAQILSAAHLGERRVLIK